MIAAAPDRQGGAFGRPFFVAALIIALGGQKTIDRCARVWDFNHVHVLELVFWVRGRALSEISLTLSADMVAALRERVRFDSDADIAAFVADAVAVYAQLGALSRTPGQLIWQPEEGPPRRLRLPDDAGRASRVTG